jgi:hypothetical protein
MVKVAPTGVSIHSHEFTTHARSAAGDAAVLHGARSLAATIADLWADRSLVDDAKAAFTAAT